MGDDARPSVRDPSGPQGAAGDPLLGRTVGGKFAIDAVLGRGAMGTVYRARQLALDKTVALKVLNRDLAADPTFADRFGREAKAASRLDHPNSIRVFDFGQDADGLLYLVMEYVEGRDLRAILSDAGLLPPPVVAHVLVQVLGALQLAHDTGVLHRDLKPENIMVVRGIGDDGSPADVVKVCDFGIAKLLNQPTRPAEDAPGRRTTAGIVVGTPEYMSPEQARGDAVDGRSDLYSVGIVLYELLTGVPPFEGTTPLNTVLKHIGETAEAPSSRRPGVDTKLEAICLRAIEKRPDDRFQTAREMRRALLACIDASMPAPSGGVLAASAALSGTIPRPPRTSDKPTLEGVSPFGPPPPPRRARSWIIGGSFLACLGVAAASLVVRTEPPLSKAAMMPSPSAGPVPSVVAAPAPNPTTPVALMPPAEPVPADPARAVAVVEAKTHHRKGAVALASPGPAVTVPSMDSAALAEHVDTPEPSPQALLPPAAVPSPPPPVATPLVPLQPPLPAPPTSPSPPPYDLAAARVEVGPPANTVGVTSVSVSRAIGEAAGAMSACYRSALPRLAGPTEGRGNLHVETDGAGVITDARLAWGGDATLVACVGRAILGHRIANVDTGNASADVPLTFRAH